MHRVILNDGFQPIDRHLARFAKRGARRAAALEIEGPDGVAASSRNTSNSYTCFMLVSFGGGGLFESGLFFHDFKLLV